MKKLDTHMMMSRKSKNFWDEYASTLGQVQTQLKGVKHNKNRPFTAKPNQPSDKSQESAQNLETKAGPTATGTGNNTANYEEYKLFSNT